MTDSKAYLSCADVARKLGLSRQRFWQLRKEGVFPKPQVDQESGRAYYSDDQLALCMDLRKRNVGMNGKIVLFYSVRSTASLPKPAKTKAVKKSATSKHTAILDSLKALGLASVADSDIASAIVSVFPGGVAGVDHGELVRAIFLHVQRKELKR